MQVWARYETRSTHGTQTITGLEHIARLDVDGSQMAHHADEPSAVVQPDGVAVEEIVARVDDVSRQRCVHRRAGSGSDVHAAVRVACLAIEDASQAKRAGAPAQRRHLHSQGERWRNICSVCRRRCVFHGLGNWLSECGHHLRQVHTLALIARFVFWRQIDRAGRYRQALLKVAFGRDGVANLALATTLRLH